MLVKIISKYLPFSRQPIKLKNASLFQVRLTQQTKGALAKKKALENNKFLVVPRQERKMSRRSHFKRLALSEPA